MCFPRMLRKGITWTLLLGMYIDTATMENSMEITQKFKNRTIIWPCHPTSEYLSKIIEIRTSNGYLHSQVYYSIIHNSQDVETTQCPLTDELIKKCGITYDGILVSLKNEGNTAICSNLNEFWGHYAKWNKPFTDRQILHDSTYMRYLK